ncbi:1-acyl-sn-glycerol-3-phosphate acyltransferase [Akkermansiaceae bacterium]|nr:1-acyl-sn-glycerol-3-phosphate acyltransferase [Akkermansiaceae bacterium]
MNTSYWVGATLFKSIGKAFFNRRVSGMENLLDEKGVLICANHESFIDPPFIGTIFNFQIAYLARKTLFKGIFKWIYESWDAIPIDQESHDLTSLKKIIKRLKDKDNVMMFPEGARTLDGELQPGMPGVGLIVAKAGCKVQPVRIFGAREVLARGSKLPNRKQVDIVIGKPLEFSKEEIKAKGKGAYQWISDEIMKAVAEIPPPLGAKQSIN